VALTVLLLVSCIAPLSRTTEMNRGWQFEAGGGISEYRGHTIVRDSSTWWGGQTALRGVNVGLYGATRVGYCANNQYGGDLTIAGAWGVPVQADGGFGGWLQVALAGKYRPWRTNNLFFAEIGYPSLAVGWVGGFPMNRPGTGQWSITARLGSTWPDELPEEINIEFLDELFPPNLFQVNVARNLYGQRRRYRLSPNLGVGIGLGWSPFEVNLSNIVAGVTFAP
jgi:hypothetical protein